jgi:hypothetical protein
MIVWLFASTPNADTEFAEDISTIFSSTFRELRCYSYGNDEARFRKISDIDIEVTRSLFAFGHIQHLCLRATRYFIGSR